MTPDDILRGMKENPSDILKAEEMRKFILGFAYRPKECKIDPEHKSLCDAYNSFNEDLDRFAQADSWEEYFRGKEKKESNMIRDFIEWKAKQEPFVDDNEYFDQKYSKENGGMQQYMRDMFVELYFIRKELDEREGT